MALTSINCHTTVIARNNHILYFPYIVTIKEVHDDQRAAA